MNLTTKLYKDYEDITKIINVTQWPIN